MLKRQMHGRANLDLLNLSTVAFCSRPDFSKVIKSPIQLQMTPGADLTGPTGTRAQGSSPHCAPTWVMCYHLATGSPPG
jgi:hypothetical protein